MTESINAVAQPNDKESTLDLARDFAIAYDDGTLEFDEDSLVRFVDVLRVEIARELHAATPIEQAVGVPELNGLTSVPCAVGMDRNDRNYGWVFIPHADGQWVTAAKLDSFSLKIIEHWIDRTVPSNGDQES